MSDTSNKDLIDLGSVPAEDFDPFAGEDELDDVNAADAGADTDVQPSAETKTQSVVTEESKQIPVSTSNDNDTEITESDNPLAAAVDAAEAKDTEKARQTIQEKLPVFEYAGAMENIEDLSLTFDELRISKATDFPELEDGKRVSWTVEYGKITKSVTDVKGMSIGKMKTDIESSKEFLDALKKAKDKNPVCKIKPRVTAQAKGAEASGYKGVFTSMDDAIASGKLITLFPARDGKVYEMRRNELGQFITPSAGNRMLCEAEAGFIPALPPIPFKQLLEIIIFFKMMAADGCNEALANIYWDKEEKIYITDIPPQTFTPVSVKGETNPNYDNDRYIHVMDIHSHNTMGAFFPQLMIKMRKRQEYMLLSAKSSITSLKLKCAYQMAVHFSK